MTTSVTNDPNISWESKDHTLNAYIELVYIRFGNQMTTEQLAKLQAALTATDNAVNTIKDIMAVRDNAVMSKPLPSFEDFAKDFNLATGVYEPGSSYIDETGKLQSNGFLYDKDFGGADQYLKAFNDVNKAYEAFKKDNQSHVFGYGKQEWTSASDGVYKDWAKNMMIYRQNLKTTIDSLATQLTPEQMNDPTGLYAKLNTVYKAMPTSADDFNGWKAWAMDGYGGGGIDATGSGKISQALDSASNAATSFLNQTTEALQRFLNIMEQYYKSANEILKTTTEIMKTFARGIAGR